MSKDDSLDLVDGMTHEDLKLFFERDPEGFNRWSKEILQAEVSKMSEGKRLNLIEMPNGGFSIKPKPYDMSKAVNAL